MDEENKKLSKSERRAMQEEIDNFICWQMDTLCMAVQLSMRIPAYPKDLGRIQAIVDKEFAAIQARWKGNRKGNHAVSLNDMYLMYAPTLDRAKEIYEGRQ